MSQWGQGQPPQGYQYPMQTGFNPQFQQQQQQPPQFHQQNPQFQPQNPQLQLNQQQGSFQPGLVPQPTGFPGAPRMQSFQQPQPTGFQQPPSGSLQSQATGFPGGGFQQRPVPPIPPQFQQQQSQNPGLLGLQQQQHPQQANRFLNVGPQLTSPGLLPQATGLPGRGPGAGGPLVSHVTGYVDPRLQMMTSTFMPMTGPSIGVGVPPQLAPQQFNLQQSFQQHAPSQNQMGWALTREEKKQYNDYFRSWDAQSTGFISGETALELFRASGLGEEDLARIWALADRDNRGKLNIAEFHVAMGLIHRRISGMPVPEQLPAELIPPSARDLGDSVDLLKDLLRHETRSHSPGNIDAPVSRLKNRSLNSTGSALDAGRDATIYKHTDSEPLGGFYQPRSRHVNRDDVRSRHDEDSPSADLSDMKRRLASTAQMLDRAAEADAARTKEDEELEREREDLKYRVNRVSDDLEYISRGPRTASKDQEKRRLERELLALMHEKIPEAERRIKAREERREREKREWARDRDRKNERFGRYDDDRGRDRPYSRGYEGERYESSLSSSYRPRSKSRSRERRDYERPRSPATRSPRPPSPPPVPAIREPHAAATSPAPKPPASPAPSKMTPEERQAFARAEAQKRIQARMAVLGVTGSPVLDTTVEDRLQQEKKEAEEKAKLAEKQAEERERARKERLENERAAKGGRSPTSPLPTPTKTAPAPAPTPRVAPPVPKPRAPAPPPPRKLATVGAAPKPPVAAPAPPAPPSAPAVDPEEEALRVREEAIKKQREARAERLRQLEREEEEEAKAEEERRLARERDARAERLRKLEQEEREAREEEERYLARLKDKSAPTPPVVVTPQVEVAPPPPPPPAPPAPAADTGKSTNPFSRLLQGGQGQAGAASTPPAPAVPSSGGASTNPWARPQTAPPQPPPVVIPPPPKSPAPASAKTYNTAPRNSIDDDDGWDDIKENYDDDSSDDELAGRKQREDIAKALFGGILPTSRPNSTAPPPKSVSPPVAPPAPPAPPMAPPAPPAPPLAPPAIAAPVAAAPSGDRSNLLKSIQGGLRLKPTKTVDKSGPGLSGRVLGDTAPPAHINAVVRSPSPPAPPSMTSSIADTAASSFSVVSAPSLELELDGYGGGSKADNRQSMGWFSERAADVGRLGDDVGVERLPSTTEEDEDDEEGYHHVSMSASTLSGVQVQGGGDAGDLLADVDKSVKHRARTLYPYEGDGPDDLSFADNLVLTAHPSKSGGDWWYGTLVKSGKSGLFPKSFIQTFKTSKAKALYTYAPSNTDELAFEEGDELAIVDKSEEEWWKAERGGVVFIVPAAYLEAVEG